MVCNEGFIVVWVWLFLLIVNFKIEGGKGDYVKIIMYIDFFLGGGYKKEDVWIFGFFL